MNNSVSILLPMISFIGLFSLIHGQKRVPDHQSEWMGSFLLAAVFWGLFVIASAEILSLFRAINQFWLSIVWAAAIIVIAVVGTRYGMFLAALERIRSIDRRLDKFELTMLVAIVVVATVLLTIAIISPPNNVDSFLYHMARVVHWAQNESLEHYPAYIDHQLNKPIWAETAILHLRVLWGNDRPANFVQWFSMIGSVIGVAGIAGLLGADRRGQWLAAVVAMTIPMGLLQATSTQNDYVTSFWAVCLAYFVVLSMKRALTFQEFLGLSSAFGIGILTKGVFFVYFPPLLLWYFLNLLRKKGILKTLGLGTAMLGIALVINLGFWVRNIQTYGGPYGTSEWLQRNLGFDVDFFNRLFETEEQMEPSGGLQLRIPSNKQLSTDVSFDDQIGSMRSPMDSLTETGRGSPRSQLGFMNSYLAQMARTIGRNFTSPFGFVTNRLVGFVERYPNLFNDSYGDELRASAWNHEDHAGNLHHLLLILAVYLALPFAFRQDRRWLPVFYAGTIALTYMLLPIIIGHAESFWGIRYQLPFFVLAAPIVAYLVSQIGSRWLETVLAGGLLVAAGPWVLLNNTRPIIGMPPWPTKIESIFVADQGQILMANNPALLDDYELTAREIAASGCTQVGLIVDQSFLEYPFWWLTRAPQSGVEIRIIVSESDDYPSLAKDFQPCAVVCTHCGDFESMHGLNDRLRFDTLSLFR